MSLQRRAFLFAFFVVFGVSLLAFGIAGALTFEAFTDIEADKARGDLRRVEQLLELERIKLDGTVQDWGAWDETYFWGAGEQPDYPEVNLQAPTLLSIDVDFVAGVRDDGEVMFTGMLDRTASETVPAPAAWDDLVAPGSPLVGFERDGEAASGFVTVDDRVVLVAARPMLRRDRSGTATGTLVFGRSLDEHRVGLLRDLLGFDVEVSVTGEQDSMATGVEFADQEVVARSVTQPLAGMNLVGFEVTTPRPIREAAARTAWLQLLLVGAAGLVAAILAARFADTRLLRRLTRLGDEVSQIGSGGNVAGRVTVDGEDELAHLARDVNDMLDGLEQVHDLRTRNAELVKADELRAEFLSMVSHELRTPLTAIMGFAETLDGRWDALDDPARRDLLGRIGHHGDQLLTIVNDLLTLTRLQSNVVEVAPSAVPVRSLVEAVLKGYPAMAPSVRVDVPDDLVAFVTPGHLEQLLVNLLTNAKKYGAPPIDVDASLEGDYVTIRVTDHGKGVPESAVGELFEPFTQASRGTRRQAHGVGLGLAIVRLLSFANAGYAHYEQPSEGGARFVLSLPAKPVPAAGLTTAPDIDLSEAAQEYA